VTSACSAKRSTANFTSPHTPTRARRHVLPFSTTRELSGEQLKLNRDDPFSFLVSTTENRMVLVDERKFDRFENPTSVDVIGSTKSTTKWIEKSTFTFSSDNMICRFCNFCCHGKEKLSKHMSRYHVDTFYCREVGTRSKITANVGTGANETMKPVASSGSLRLSENARVSFLFCRRGAFFNNILRIEIENYPILMTMGMY
jgi:hypothetical protein